ncbi:MAG: DNA polymerase III subunit gamma/tau [bacterium]|nr:DNA polymerase III subunit gamma/tau [bacterium]
MVFYRKYRPQTIEELDIPWIRQNLGAVLSSGKVPHALLFTGPRGLGKTSTARIVAKGVNCLNNAYGKLRMENGEKEKAVSHKPADISQFEPCNECDSCVSITNGRNLDVLEIDAASNRGIDEIRDLREKIKLAPSSLRFKVYIIDEVHMLTTEAFNALLKTLEEPPPHVIFILCTTEAHKLPATIISRCLRFDFKRATKADLVRSLGRLVIGENLKVENEVLEEIARGADGSFRDAAKILEQAVLSGKEITGEKIREILGETQSLKPEKLLKLLARGETREAVLEINRIVEAGDNIRVYTEKLLGFIHQVLMVKVGVKNGDEEIEVTELSSSLQKERILSLIELFSRAHGELKTAVIPQLPLELAVVEWCETIKSGVADGLPTSDSLPEAAGPAARQPHADSTPLTSGGAPRMASRLASPASDSIIDQQSELLSDRGRPTIKPSINSPKHSLEEISAIWPQIIEATKEYNHTIAGVLRGCRPQNFDGRILTIETFYKFHRDKLNEPKMRELLDKAVAKVLGENVGLKCVLGEKEGK